MKSKDGATLYDQIYSYQGYYHLTEYFAPQGADSLLDVLNSNAKWNNGIDEAFEDLYTILSQLGVYNDMKQELTLTHRGCPT